MVTLIGKIISAFTIIIFISLSMTGCGFYGGGIKGQVFIGDKKGSYEKMTPSSDTFILVKWSGIVPRPAEGLGYCFKAKIIKTDNNGSFDSGGTWMLPKPYPIIKMSAHATLYKPGYQLYKQSSSDYLGKYILIPTDESPKDRLYRLYLYSDFNDCSDIEKDINLQSYLEALLEEAKSLPIPNIENESYFKEIKSRIQMK